MYVITIYSTGFYYYDLCLVLHFWTCSWIATYSFESSKHLNMPFISHCFLWIANFPIFKSTLIFLPKLIELLWNTDSHIRYTFVLAFCCSRNNNKIFFMMYDWLHKLTTTLLQQKQLSIYLLHRFIFSISVFTTSLFVPPIFLCFYCFLTKHLPSKLSCFSCAIELNHLRHFSLCSFDWTYLQVDILTYLLIFFDIFPIFNIYFYCIKIILCLLMIQDSRFKLCEYS